MKYIKWIGLLVIAIALGSYYASSIWTRLFGPVSLEKKIDHWNFSKGKIETDGIVWVSKSLTMISEKGEVLKVQIGLEPTGNFVWRSAPEGLQAEDFSYGSK